MHQATGVITNDHRHHSLAAHASEALRDAAAACSSMWESAEKPCVCGSQLKKKPIFLYYLSVYLFYCTPKTDSTVDTHNAGIFCVTCHMSHVTLTGTEEEEEEEEEEKTREPN